LLIEKNRCFSLSCEGPVNFSRPSIDILFETAAEAYRDKFAAIILTGASRDGADGIQAVRKHGGLTIAQDPLEAQFPFMPTAAIETGCVQHIYKLKEIKDFLLDIGKEG